MLKREVKVIGIGNCGCKITKGFLEKGYETMFINGSEQDIQYLGKEIPGDKIMKLKGFDGFGGDTKKSMECLTSNLEVVQSIQDVSEEVVFVIASGAGSTGSGLLEPTISILLGELEEELDDKAVTWYANRIIVPIICLPYKEESILKQKNAYQLVKNIMQIDQVGAMIFVDNNTNINKKEGYDKMNKILVDSLDLFLSDNSVGDRNNFDTSEKKMMLREKGAFILCLSKSKDLPQEKEAILDSIKDGCVFAAIEEDGICGNIAVLHKGDDESDIEISDIAKVVGNPINSFEGFNAEETLVVISGLTYPMTLIKDIAKKAKEGQADRKEKRRNFLAGFDGLEDLDEGDDFIEEPTIVKISGKQEDGASKSLASLREKMLKKKK